MEPTKQIAGGRDSDAIPSSAFYKGNAAGASAPNKRRSYIRLALILARRSLIWLGLTRA